MLTRRCIAIGSGKGGVGKSTTTINIALMLAKHAMRVAIVDLDPLSNITTILDLARENNAAELGASTLTLEQVTLNACPGCDVLFPHTKDIEQSAPLIKTLVFKSFATLLAKKYDLLLFDLPAGIRSEQSYQFLPLVAHLVVVVQPEPTSHVSSGGYVKASLQMSPRLNIYFWHNRFEIQDQRHFYYDDVINNYQKFVDKSLWLSAQEQKRCCNISYVPRDDILDLLNVTVRPLQSILYKCQGVLRMLFELLGRTRLRCSACNRAQQQQVYHFLISLYPLEQLLCDTASTITEELYLYWEQFYSRSSRIAPAEQLQRSQQAHISQGISTLISQQSFRLTIKTIRLLEQFIDQLLQSKHSSYQRQQQLYEKALQEMLYSESSATNQEKNAKNARSLLFAYAALAMTINAASVQQAVLSYIPIRKEGPEIKRDRQRQIAHLINHNSELHRRHLEIVKKMLPLFLQELEQLAVRYSTTNYIFFTAEKTIDRALYIRLLSQALHDIAYSGLGVVIGLPLSPSYQAIYAGSLKLMRQVGEGASL